MIPMRSAVTSSSAAFAPSSRRNQTAPRRSATTSGFIVSATASSGCSVISRSTAPSPHDMTNSPIASLECYISQPRVTGSNLSTRPRTARHAPCSCGLDATDQSGRNPAFLPLIDGVFHATGAVLGLGAHDLEFAHGVAGRHPETVSKMIYTEAEAI